MVCRQKWTLWQLPKLKHQWQCSYKERTVFILVEHSNRRSTYNIKCVSSSNLRKAFYIIGLSCIKVETHGKFLRVRISYKFISGRKRLRNRFQKMRVEGRKYLDSTVNILFKFPNMVHPMRIRPKTIGCTVLHLPTNNSSYTRDCHKHWRQRLLKRSQFCITEVHLSVSRLEICWNCIHLIVSNYGKVARNIPTELILS